MKKSFYLQQEEAKVRTRRLFVAFHFVVTFTAIVTTLFFIFFTSSQLHTSDQIIWSEVITNRENQFVFLIVYLMIVLVSWVRGLPLKSGGAYVAKMVGGREISYSTKDLREKQLINIVEEMGIASGITLPRVFVLDNEDSINAFAAGTTIKNACVAVSSGALKRLDRSQLQGVIAHEFSHILNGDMALNVHLLGYLYGLTSISDAGRILLRSSNRRNNKNNALPLFGLGLYVIGSLGYFLAFLLKAGISRDRERLADASAVQFTRNPEGIGGALRKIWKENSGKLQSSRSSEISHFYLHWPQPFISFLATHPPILERIRNLGLNPEGVTNEASVNSSFNQLEAVSSFSSTNLKKTNSSDEFDPEYYIFAFFLWFEDSPSIGPIEAVLRWNKELNEDLLRACFKQVSLMPDEERFVFLERNIAKLRNFESSKISEILSQLKALIEQDGNITHREFIFYYYLRLALRTEDKLKIKRSHMDQWSSIEVLALFYGSILRLSQPEELSRDILNLLGKKSSNLRIERVEQVRDALSVLTLARPHQRHAIYKAFKDSMSRHKQASEVSLSLKLLALILEVVD